MNLLKKIRQWLKNLKIWWQNNHLQECAQCNLPVDYRIKFRKRKTGKIYRQKVCFMCAGELINNYQGYYVYYLKNLG